jgi:hypothetical protein
MRAYNRRRPQNSGASGSLPCRITLRRACGKDLREARSVVRRVFGRARSVAISQSAADAELKGNHGSRLAPGEVGRPINSRPARSSRPRLRASPRRSRFARKQPLHGMFTFVQRGFELLHRAAVLGSAWSSSWLRIPKGYHAFQDESCCFCAFVGANRRNRLPRILILINSAEF